MGEKSCGLCVVEVMQTIQVAGHSVRPGARLLAWKGADGWRVTFNGAEVQVPPGTVGKIDSPEVREATERRSAREEEYQSATK